MQTTSESVVGNIAKASRAMGAMFFSAFGGVWLGVWANDEFAGSVSALLIVAALTAALFAVSYRTYQANASALKAVENTPESRQKSRRFNLVNAVQWGVIFLVAFALSQAGQTKWILPAVIFIIGLHFLPLAHLFAYRPHYLTGAALIVLACVYPLVAREGPESNISALGTGLILWLSAAWAISR